MRGDTRSAIAELETAAAELRDLMSAHRSVTLEIQLASTLDDLADALSLEEDFSGAEALQVECLAMMRRHLDLAPEAVRTRSNVADALERLAATRMRTGDLESALDLSREAVELRRAVAVQTGTGIAESDLGLSLARTAEVASRRSDFDDRALDGGYAPVREALALLRAAHERDANARSAWRLVYGIKVALPYEVSRAGLAAARALLDEADTVREGLPVEARGLLDDAMRGIEGLRAMVLESDGDLLGAAQARARANALANPHASEADGGRPLSSDDLGPN